MRPISQRQADELPCFLPDFERPGREFDEGLGGGETTENGITGFYIRYPEGVEAFFRLIEEGPLVDYNYDPEQVAAWIEDPEQIKRATIHEVRAALTYCSRLERFCDGCWADLLNRGIVQALLRRLAELKPDLPA